MDRRKDAAPQAGALRPVERRIDDALRARRCAVIEAAGHAWETGNSVVVSSPELHVASLFDRGAAARAALNVIFIDGPTDEALHHHHSHVIAIVVAGDGWLEVPNPDGPGNERLRVSAGDIAVVPEGAPHIFNVERGGKVLYAAIEISDREIDYQKHWHDDEQPRTTAEQP